MNGYLLVDKPIGWSSFDVIKKLRNLASVKKVGHAGTLDPMATGLLIVLFGSATKQQDQFMKLDKTYEAELTLGAVSSTEDSEGEITGVSDHKPSREEVEGALLGFLGKQLQIPSSYSAIKVNGQRAYKLARSGSAVKLEPRPIVINSLEIVSYGYPTLTLKASVSSGTYIRALARDIGERLQVGAYLSRLRRTSIGDYLITNSVQVEDLDRQKILDSLIPVLAKE